MTKSGKSGKFNRRLWSGSRYQAGIGRTDVKTLIYHTDGQQQQTMHGMGDECKGSKKDVPEPSDVEE